MFWAWHGASGVDDSGVTRYSFAGAGVCPVGSWLSLRDLLCFLCALVSFSLCWAACLGVADADMDSNLSLARLKLIGSQITTSNHHCSPMVHI